MSLAISSASDAQPANLFEGYQPPPGVYDEMYSAPGVLRAHWREFVAGVNTLGRQELGRRWEQAQRLIRENGISYNVHGDPAGRDRPWELDGLPLLLPAAEWTAAGRRAGATGQAVEHDPGRFVRPANRPVRRPTPA